MAKKEKKIVFSEIIDNRINGFAIGISFALISLFLLNNASYFRNHIVTYAVGAVFGVFGVAGIGVEFRLGRYVGLYIDPSLRYYFNNGQPKSIRSSQPLMLGFEAGLRFNL